MLKYPRFLSILFLVGALAFIGFSPIAAQTESSTEAELPTFSEVIDVSIVTLNVVVVGEDDVPVTGLRPQDFSITDNGTPVTLTDFREIRQGKKFAASFAAPEAPNELMGPDHELIYMAFLFDPQSLERRNRNRSVKDLREFLPNWLLKNGSVLLATTKANGEIEVVQGFTEDWNEIDAGLDKILELDTFGEMINTYKRRLKRDMVWTRNIELRGIGGQGGTPVGINQVASLKVQVENFRRQEVGRIEKALISIDNLSRGLSGLSGRKHLVYVGQGLAIRPSVDVYSTLYQTFQNHRKEIRLIEPEMWGMEENLSPVFKRLAGRAHVAEVVMHILDAADHNANAGVQDLGVSFSNIMGVISSAIASPADLHSSFEGSQFLANTTGGRSFFNSRRINSFFEALDKEALSYYALTYTVEGKADGKLRRPRISVNRKGLEVRHHEIYQNRTLDQELFDRALSRLVLESPENHLGVEVTLPAFDVPVDGKTFTPPFVVSFPMENLGLNPVDQGFQANLQLLAIVEDDDGNRYPSPLFPIEMSIPSKSVEQVSRAGARVELQIRTNSKRIAIAARDDLTGMQGVALINLELPGSRR